MRTLQLVGSFILATCIASVASAAPFYSATSSYNSGLGVIEWEIKLHKHNPPYTGSFAIEYPVTLSAVGDGFVTSLESARGDDTNGVANATWYYNETAAGSGVLLWNLFGDPNDHTQINGFNPFTGTITDGLYIDTANRLFFSALGSDVNLPNPIPTLHVASSDGILRWDNAIVAENGVQFTGIDGMASSIIVGDMNGDGSMIVASDFAPFQLAKTSPAAYEAAFPGLDYRARGDINGDGRFNFQDQMVPEPSATTLTLLGAIILGFIRRRT